MAIVIKKVVIMAGGTGGHIFPGLAIAKALHAKNIEVCWLGSAEGLETTLVPNAGLPLHTLPIQALRGKQWHQQLFMPFRLFRAIYHAYHMLKHERPDIVLGMGGFVAGPGGIAAKLLGVPLIIHEQNSIAGMTNRWLAHLATRVLCAFPGAFPHKYHAIVTGNPVRAEIAALPPPSQRFVPHRQKLNLLVLGGSRGAQALNTIVPTAIAVLSEKYRPHIWHQTGQSKLAQTQQQYEKHAIYAKIDTFIDNMADSYAWADVVICRAGALTIAELMAAGIAAILVPYPHAADDHQTYNARYLVDRHAAVLLPNADLTPTSLSAVLLDLLLSDEKRLDMANNACKLFLGDAVENVIHQLEW